MASIKAWNHFFKLELAFLSAIECLFGLSEGLKKDGGAGHKPLWFNSEVQWGTLDSQDTMREDNQRKSKCKKKKSQGGGEKKPNRRQNRWVWGGHAAWASFASWFTWLEALWWLLLRLLLGFTRCYGSASAASIAAVLTVLPWCAFAGAWSAVWARVLAVSVALALGRGRLGCARTTVRFFDSGHLCI